MDVIKIYSDLVRDYLPGLKPFEPHHLEDGSTQLTWEDDGESCRFMIYLAPCSDPARGSLADSSWGLLTKKEMGRIMLSGSLNIDNFQEILEWVSQYPGLPLST
jgi:hypothetical protein